MLKLIFSSFLFLAIYPAFSQTEDTVTVTQKTADIPTIVDHRLFNGIRIGTDLAGIAFGMISKNANFKVSNRYEINADFGIKRWFLLVEAGTGTFKRPDSIPNSNPYKSSGQYIRIGGDYRLSKSAKSFLFIGGRVAQGFFQETGSYIIPAVVYNDFLLRPETTQPFKKSLNVNWVELTSGIKVYIWQNIYLGYTIKFKFLIPSQKIKELKPLDIPGYGIGNRNTNLGFSFNIMYRIPFGKDPIIPLKGR